MIKSIWEKIKLKFERKPVGDVQLSRENWPSYGGDTLTEGEYKLATPIVVMQSPATQFDSTTLSSTGVAKPKRVRKPKNESA